MPFTRDVEIPKYDKYDGNGDPDDYIRKFYALSRDLMHEDTYLRRLFQRSLSGKAMEWFTKNSPPIKYFDELVKSSIQHPITMLDICNTKQKKGEPFISYLQRWRKLHIRYPRQITKNEKIDIFFYHSCS